MTPSLSKPHYQYSNESEEEYRDGRAKLVQKHFRHGLETETKYTAVVQLLETFVDRDRLLIVNRNVVTLSSFSAVSDEQRLE